MSNQNYDQVDTLVAEGSLKWEQDQIVALLVQNATFNRAHKTLGELGAKYLTSAPINGRWVGEGGMGMGQPAVFQKVNLGEEFQVLVAKDEGRGDPLVLAFLDVDNEGNPITVVRTGSLIIRPSQENMPSGTVEPPPTTGFWLKL